MQKVVQVIHGQDPMVFTTISLTRIFLIRHSPIMGCHYVEITTLGGCKAYDSTYAAIIGTDVYAGPDTSICNGNAISLYASERH
jgi:hypothetical protein